MKLQTIAPKILQVNFLPTTTGMVMVVGFMDGGGWVKLFEYNKDEINFTRQELVGLTRQEAKWLKDKKLDEFIGFNQT